MTHIFRLQIDYVVIRSPDKRDTETGRKRVFMSWWLAFWESVFRLCYACLVVHCNGPGLSIAKDTPGSLLYIFSGTSIYPGSEILVEHGPGSMVQPGSVALV